MSSKSTISPSRFIHRLPLLRTIQDQRAEIADVQRRLANLQLEQAKKDEAYETLKSMHDSLVRKTKALTEKTDRKTQAHTRVISLLSLDGPEFDTALKAEIARAPRSAWFYVLRTSMALANHEKRGGMLLLNDTRTQDNIGCRSTTTHLLRALDAAGARCHSTVTLAELKLLAPTLWHVAGARPLTDNIEKMVTTFRDHAAFSLYRRAIDAASSVVINGEGSFYDEQEKGLVLLVMAVYAAREARTPVAIINHSAELSHPVMAAWSAAAYPLMRAVTFREHISARRLPSGMSGATNLSIGADAAFLAVRDTVQHDQALTISSDALLDTPVVPPYVVLTGTSSIYRPDRPPFQGEETFAELCWALRDEDGVMPVLWEGDASDAKLLRPIALRLQLPYVSAGITTGAALGLLSGATATISGRWHASILSACAGTPPILGDANFFKTEALQEMLKLEWPMFDYRTLDVGAVRRCVRMIVDGGDRLRASIKAQAFLQAEKVQQDIEWQVARLTRSPPLASQPQKH